MPDWGRVRTVVRQRVEQLECKLKSLHEDRLCWMMGDNFAANAQCQFALLLRDFLAFRVDISATTPRAAGVRGLIIRGDRRCIGSAKLAKAVPYILSIHSNL